jgi:stearoyl-CoA desaturase (delta-9 desaturase)
VIHLAALLALHPWFFSWIGLAAFVLGIYVFATLGINLGFHRLLTHRGLRVPKWLEHTLVTLGVCSLQNSPVRWVAVHRLHHQHSDERPDPHSPLVRFLWAHVGWVVVENRELNSLSFYEHYAHDVLRDPFYLRFERRNLWFWAALYPAIAYCVAGAVLGYFLSGTLLGGVQLGLSLVVWGVFARLVYSWHATWSVNSLTHLWGYRNYETNENSRNNFLVALLAAGEGWHNNHHADQRSAAHGHRWWEFDLTWLTIRALARLGLATDVVYPRFKTAGRATSPEDSPAE